TTAEKVTHEVFIVKKDAKLHLLGKLLAQYQGSILLFSRTKHNAKKIVKKIRNMKHTAAEIHSNRSLSQRREALEGFKSGRYRVLVATDIASRGIDVSGIELVINYDLPDDAQNYVHRIGRTGRAGHKGHAISFAMPDQSRDVRNIEKLIRISLPVSKHQEISQEHFIQTHHKSPDRYSKHNRRQRHRRPIS
ncbi:MAG: C-terminal helicase domain-containing protein, partial [Candidatus Omnitrophica bacterium]|nr:C-terminal helicase domain-containing protein [Candidatus Omnitrophota bacterium]